MGPDFIIIGAMKCATSSLHEQLAVQPGFFMTTPKEPNYFSDDDEFARGPAYYEGLFAGSEGAKLRGESSTHYTKMPTYPRACSRMKEALPQLKLIYMMRHPIDRLVSHYIHEWTQRVIDRPIDLALDAHPELIAYSRYAYQLEPYIAAYGKDAILPVFMERFNAEPQAELERVCSFLGYEGTPRHDDDMQPQNVSSERLRLGPLGKFIVDQPILTALRRNLVPRGFRDVVKSQFQMRKRPTLSADSTARLKTMFDEDLKDLGRLLGTELTCDTFKSTVKAQSFTLL